ncbi:MAG: hypothetical protein H6Q73_387 [Firmicutes bacterium]|nr:hypothetical protein [Bacillota bacterium]
MLVFRWLTDGGVSPLLEIKAMMGAYDLEGLKKYAKYLTGINKKLPIYEWPTVALRRML